jgi:hypothetical protein
MDEKLGDMLAAIDALQIVMVTRKPTWAFLRLLRPYLVRVWACESM